MTNSALIERIARRWCELMKRDPDEIVVEYNSLDPNPETYFAQIAAVNSLRWEIVAREVPAQLAWMLAINEVMG